MKEGNLVKRHLQCRCDVFNMAKYCMIYTFVFGLMAHLYAFANFTISHDSLVGFHSLDETKVELGRFGVVLYKYITSGIATLPWTAGIIALLFVGISNTLICRIFGLQTVWQMMLVSGIMVTNTTLTSLIATYMHDLGADTLALLMSVFAAYIWNVFYKNPSENLKNIILPAFVGILSMIIALSLYQAYLSVTVIIILFVLFIDMLEGKTFWQVMKAGLFAAGCILVSCLIYLLLVDVACEVSGLPKNTESYNSISNMTNDSISFLSRLYTTYFDVLQAFILHPISSFRYPIVRYIHCGLLLFFAILFIRKWWDIGIKEKALTVIMIVIAPFAMNISGFLDGMSHDLMIYALWLVYIPFIVLVSRENGWKVVSWEKRGRIVAAALIGVVIVQNVQTANTVYVKKDAGRQATISRVTSILAMIEQQEGYVYGETPVALLGYALSNEEPMLQEGNIEELTGGSASQITYSSVWNAYLGDVLSYQINLCGVEQVQQLQARPDVMEMPCFPSYGGVRMIDGIIVVKLSNDGYR